MNNSEYDLLTKAQIVERYDELFDYTTQLENELERAKQEIFELEFENSHLYENGLDEGKELGHEAGYEQGYDAGYEAGLNETTNIGDLDERF